MTVEQAAESASHVLISVVTLVVSEPGHTAGSAEGQEAAVRAKRAYLLSLSLRRYPHVVAAADTLSECASTDAYYRRGLDLIVTGLRGMQNAAQPALG